jgi:hypothetical protein
MNFSCTDKETLVSYIYGECDAATRGAVDSHLAGCPACTDEVAGFGAVRETLSQWAAPERAGGFRLVRDEEAPATTAPATVLRPARWWQSALPALARAAAAILLVAGGAALANLEVRYDKDGFVVRTGWQKASPAVVRVSTPTQAPAPQPAAAVSVPGETPAADFAAFRSELAAFQRQMRDEVRQQLATVKTSAPAPVQVAGNVGFDENRFMQRVYTALDESERRQQVNVATYMSRLVNDLQAGRSIDMRRIGFDALPPALPQSRPRNSNLFDVSPVGFPVKK